MQRPARTVAPLVGLKYCDLMQGDFEVDTDLYFEAAPKIALDQIKRDCLGEIAVDELMCSGWGFRREYDPEPGVHLGQREKDAEQILHQALLALWIAKPTGANYSWFLNYHDRLGSDAASVQRFDSIYPLVDYENAKITNSDLNELKLILARDAADICRESHHIDSEPPVRHTSYGQDGTTVLDAHGGSRKSLYDVTG